MIKAVCFDLDGTLLPLDIDGFCKYYFGMLAKKMTAHGYDPSALIGAIVGGTKAMHQNDGSKTNEEAFWQYFCGVFGEQAREDMPYFAEFYETEFDKARGACGFDENAAPTVRACRALGLRVCAATNPYFPEIATRKRLQWAGVDPKSIEFYTTYEDCCYCKPNPQYYLEVAARLGLAPTECLMVGNDVTEDMAAAEVGMQVFLLVNEHLINKENKDINAYPHGDFAALLDYIRTLL